MEFFKDFEVMVGTECVIRSCNECDGNDVLEVLGTAHRETDFLLTYPGELTFTPEQEADFLKTKKENPREVQLGAFVDGKLAGIAGVSAVSSFEKLRHRADLGISILQKYWGRGIGSALLDACIECAKNAGYTQLELSVLEKNPRACALYRKKGFAEYGKNPRGFMSRIGEEQALVYMLLSL